MTDKNDSGPKPSRGSREVVKQTVNAQRAALSHLLTDDAVTEIIAVARAIDNADGQIIVSGVGKSGDVSKKITATLKSIGVPSTYLHPVEALHGDLGIVSPDDVVILISNSGNTDEMVELVRVLSSFSPTTVAITSNPDSRLAKTVEFHVDTGVSNEGAVVSQVPMASTTTTMVVGDCIANAIMDLRNFEEEDFGYLHPGGTIGKKLLLDVRDIMAQEMPLTSPDNTLAETAVKMSQGGKGIAVICDDEDRLLGILTDGDLRRLIQAGTDLHDMTARDAMIEGPITIGPDVPAIRALNIIEDNNITQLVVVDENEVFQGVIHFHDIMQEGLST